MKARVGYSLGRTINTGNYENVKVDVSLQLECNEADVEKTFERARRFVSDRVAEEEKEWLV